MRKLIIIISVPLLLSLNLSAALACEIICTQHIYNYSPHEWTINSFEKCANQLIYAKPATIRHDDNGQPILGPDGKPIVDPSTTELPYYYDGEGESGNITIVDPTGAKVNWGYGSTSKSTTCSDYANIHHSGCTGVVSVNRNPSGMASGDIQIEPYDDLSHNPCGGEPYQYNKGE